MLPLVKLRLLLDYALQTVIHILRFMTAIEFFESIGPSLIARTQELDMQVQLPQPRKAITQALDKTVLLGGKRLRPLLTYLVGECLGVDLTQLDLFARSIEQVHAASLSHDDVIDNATKRRGKESINILTSNKQAILAGDYLLANVICQLTEFGNLEVVGETAKVISDLSEGEWLQLELSQSRAYQMQDIINVANFKTASVMKWCCVVPAIVSGCQAEVVNLWREFGYHLGLSFQFIDDTLDFTGNKEKEALIDLQNGIVNMVLYHWLQDNPKIHESYKSGTNLIDLWGAEDKAQAVQLTRELALSHLDKCYALLDQIEMQFQATEQSELFRSFSQHRKKLEVILEFLKYREN